ncbi:hypothetical protein WA158_003820 [Blastocystis sp. Blastoise]
MFFTLLHGIASWFDVVFNGSEHLVVLSTAPQQTGTHWYQGRLLFEQPLAVNAGQVVSGIMTMDVNDNKSYDIHVKAWIEKCIPKIETSGFYHLHDQLCYTSPSYDNQDNSNF